MVENRSRSPGTGGLALPAPAVPPVSDREQPFRFALAGCSVGVEVGVLNVTLPPLGIPPREPGGGCQNWELAFVLSWWSVCFCDDVCIHERCISTTMDGDDNMYPQ